ncbi:MAG: PglZ domain-containing protein [Gemmatales bacterium]|nr:PglZ domain-containing protein [Gemmatales bacterium]MDW7993059.1 PglZ domain-containing protein [Gemmatales bacterium]
MAALLPEAHQSLGLVALKDGRLGVKIGARVIADRKDRLQYIRERVSCNVRDCKLEQLLPKPNKRREQDLAQATLLVVTSQEIDELGETDNIAQARLHMNALLAQLRRVVRILVEHGFTIIILTADHGYLFADETTEPMKIEPPAGSTVNLRRRLWLGSAGTSAPSSWRVPLQSFGLETDLEFATPKGFAVFRCKSGNRAYFHGGVSPQEMIIPVLTVTAKAKPRPRFCPMAWTLTPGAAKITTRFFSVRVSGQATESSLFGAELPQVRVEIRAGRKVVSRPVSASYGFDDATGDVHLKFSDADPQQVEPNTIALMLEEDINQPTATIHLVDSATHVELATPLTVEVAIAI